MCRSNCHRLALSPQYHNLVSNLASRLREGAVNTAKPTNRRGQSADRQARDSLSIESRTFSARCGLRESCRPIDNTFVTSKSTWISLEEAAFFRDIIIRLIIIGIYLSRSESISQALVVAPKMASYTAFPLPMERKWS